MSTISQRTGFSPALLRAWERRHGLLDPERTEGGHRLYTDDDLSVLAQVKQLLDSGRAIGEIASMGREHLLTNAAAPGLRHRERVLPPDVESTLGQLSQALVAGAIALDEAAIEAALDETFLLLSPQAAMERAVLPALVTIGDLWAQGTCSIAGEHLASAKVVGRLLMLLETLNPALGNGSRAAIVACLPDERHEVGPLVTGCILAKHYYRVSYLGASLPLEELERSCHLLKPDVVCLSVSRESLLETHEPRLVESVKRLPPRTQAFLGGRGVTASDPSLVAAGLVMLTPDGPQLADYLTGKAPLPAKGRRPRKR